MTTATLTMPEDTAAMARTIRRLQARNIVLEAEVERLKAALAAKEPKRPSRAGLTPKQRALLDFIARYQRERRGVSPSFDEMAHAIGLASKSGVHRLIEGLVARGALERLPHQARALRVVAIPSHGDANG
ncbi:LexA DNA binding domain-containing protein [Azospirillum oryzae]|uniref:LexA DNA binding domain-containing protein n=1 Tax=Azospirillum oryzae TaxID=286727 RepID=A0A1X7F8E8_9PROT|nr:LexA DNA binding domain-containing protein [Azospirillum oryzae]